MGIGASPSEPRILVSLSKPDEAVNPFIPMFVHEVGAETDLVTFSWKRALFGRFDVFHVHWPDHLFIGRNFLLKVVKPILFLLVLLISKIRRRKIVWTVHNLEPHRAMNYVERFCYYAFRRSADANVLLSPAADLDTKCESVVIPHPHYRDWVVSPAQEDNATRTQSCDFLFFGTILPYKRVDRLIEVFKENAALEMSLRVVGDCGETSLQRKIEAFARTNSNVSCRLERISDPQLWDEISRSRLVILPYPGMYNSGAALLSLSLDKPIVVPDTVANRVLREDVGAEWVYTYKEPLNADKLRQALEWDVQANRASTVPLDSRSWPRIARMYSELYRSVSHAS